LVAQIDGNLISKNVGAITFAVKDIPATFSPNVNSNNFGDLSIDSSNIWTRVSASLYGLHGYVFCFKFKWTCF